MKPSVDASREQFEIIDKADEALWASFRRWMIDNPSPYLTWTLSERLNNASGMLTFAVSRNHRSSIVWDMLDWVAANGPASYGLFYVHDDEDELGNRHYGRGDIDCNNQFMVHRLMAGRIQELPDPFFGPIIPNLESL